MAVESAADRAAFFSLNDFGVSATYTPAGGASVTIAGIFDNDFVALDTAGGVAVAMQQPRFLCRTAQVAAAKEGDALTVDTVGYTIRVVEDDGTGITTLVLERN